MKRMLCAALCGVLTLGLLSGCGGDVSGSGENTTVGYEPPKYVCTKQTSADGSYITYDYDRDGRQTKAANYSAKGNLLSWTEYIYNEDGWKSAETAYDADGKIQTHSEIEYDGGNMTSWTCYDGDDKQQYQETYEYDENGFMVKETHTEDTMSYSFDIEVDENGNETKRTMTDDSEGSALVTEMNYNSAGLLIKSTELEGGKAQNWTEYDYDANGNLIRQTLYNASAQVDTIWEYTYNKDDNLISVTINGTGSAEVLYTYDYMTLQEYLD